MKKLLIVFAVIICFACSTDKAKEYPTDDCEEEYANLIEELNSSQKILKSEKEKYLPGLEKALKLCLEGKPEEADKIVQDLKQQGLSEEMFDSMEGN
jgi:hypothetical protein